MGTFKRIKRIIKAEMNDSLNNPEKALSKQIEAMEATIVKLRQSIAQASSAKRRTQESYNFYISEITRWKKRAELALSANDENLAREALFKKKYFQDNVAKLKTQIEFDQNTAIIANLQQKLTALEMKVIDYKMLQTRLNTTKEQKLFKETIDGIDTSSAMGAFERMEDKVRQLEAESQSVVELGGQCLEEQFAKLEVNFEDELAELKAQVTNSSNNFTDSAIDNELEELRAQLNDY